MLPKTLPNFGLSFLHLISCHVSGLIEPLSAILPLLLKSKVNILKVSLSVEWLIHFSGEESSTSCFRIDMLLTLKLHGVCLLISFIPLGLIHVIVF